MQLEGLVEQVREFDGVSVRSEKSLKVLAKTE
jgi:hypothetical protein